MPTVSLAHIGCRGIDVHEFRGCKIPVMEYFLDAFPVGSGKNLTVLGGNDTIVGECRHVAIVVLSVPLMVSSGHGKHQ